MYKVAIFTAAVSIGSAVFAAAPVVSVKCPRESAVFADGEKVEFVVSTVCDGVPTSLPVQVTARYPEANAKADVKSVRTAADGTAKVSYSPKLPGWVYVQVSVTNAKGKVASKASVGAIYRPDDIRPAMPPPDDFKAFWDAAIAELDKVPIRAKLEPVELTDKESNGGKIKGFEFSIDCVGPYPATGFLAMPVDAKPKSLPIIVAYQGASGVRAWKSWHYGDVAISLTASKFGLPNRLTDKEYAEMGYDGSVIYKLAKDPAATRDDNVFKWMILRDLRVQQYAKTLPEWNGKVMLVNGESLGGAQSLICGALDPDVTFISACVPALCDHNAWRASRRNGWPNLFGTNEDGSPATPEAAAKLEAARYFDTANFTTLITPSKEVTVGTGYIDTTCPPDGVYAAFSAIPSNVVKRLSPRPLQGHGAGNEYGGVRIAEILGKQ
jgi:cephalosporin-C deacetylase-like acetyl esterase